MEKPCRENAESSQAGQLRAGRSASCGPGFCARPRAARVGQADLRGCSLGRRRLRGDVLRCEHQCFWGNTPGRRRQLEGCRRRPLRALRTGARKETGERAGATASDSASRDTQEEAAWRSSPSNTPKRSLVNWAVVERRANKAHDIAYVYHEGRLIASFGIRRGSRKDLGHGHLPGDLHLRPHETLQLAHCTLSRQAWLEKLRERGWL